MDFYMPFLWNSKIIILVLSTDMSSLWDLIILKKSQRDDISVERTSKIIISEFQRNGI